MSPPAAQTSKVRVYALAVGLATLLVCPISGSHTALAQSTTLTSSLLTTDVNNPDGNDLIIDADQVTYDSTNDILTAIGNVQLYYQGSTVDADLVSYNQKTGRVFATGSVTIIQPDGTIINAENIDLTEELGSGFVEAINVLTPERTQLRGRRAESTEDGIYVLENGVYTACQDCLSPEAGRPLWQIKARKIIYDENAKEVRYRDARLEVGGVPVLYSPYFFHPDPTVKRKSGFLPPTYLFLDEPGFGVGVPFFWALDPSYDITITPTYFSNQGLLADLRWRHRISPGGSYSVEAAGIFQQNASAFAGEPGDESFRGSVSSKGDFSIAPGWSWGWNTKFSSDQTFSRDYGLEGLLAQENETYLYLNGVRDRNRFEMSARLYQVLNSAETSDVQPYIHPVVDHDYHFDEPVFGGELSLTSNVTSLSRETNDLVTVGSESYLFGSAGNYTKATTDIQWQRRYITPGGHLITPYFSARGDAYSLKHDDTAAPFYTEDKSFVGRFIPTAGIDYRWPILSSTALGTQVFEPIAQVVVRPKETAIGQIPNEDAQSLVFDDTTLFEWDKFSGTDRVEGGVRSNLGIEYALSTPFGLNVNALVGRSFQLAGANSFAADDLTNTGNTSGLESDASDYVARVSLDTPGGFRLTARGRFDDETLDLNRAEFSAAAQIGPANAAIGYLFVEDRPDIGIFSDTEEITASASVQLTNYWRAFGSTQYDLETQSLVSDSLGIAYDGDSTSFSIYMSGVGSSFTDIDTTRTVYMRLELRTLGELATTRELAEVTQ